MAKVLVVDDSAVARDLVGLTLRHSGHDVVEASSGREALELVHKLMPDLLISDILMPDMDGYELAFALRGSGRFESLPILLFSASYDEAELADLDTVYLGCSFLRKPASPQEILDAVEAALNEQPAGPPLSRSTHHFEIERNNLVTAKLMRMTEELERQRAGLLARAAQQHDLAVLSHAALAANSSEELFEIVLGQVQRTLDVEYTLLLEFADGELPTARAGRGWPTEVTSMGAIELGYHELAVELRSARGAVTTFDLDESPHAVPPLFVDHGIRSSVNALVGRPDAPFGILGAQTHQARSFTEDERDFLVGAASMLAQAIARVNERGDREAIQAQAEEAQRLEALGRLAGGIAHDFNNVLAVIRLQCAAIMRRSPDESTLEAMKQIDAAADRAGGVTRQLLVFGRSQILEPQVTDLNEVVEATVGLLGRFLGEDIETSCDLAPELDRTLVDRGQMTQVVLNLAVNARDAMDRGGLLSFRTRNVEVTTAAPSADLPPGRYVCLEVRDTGVGMTAETQRRVFEPFFTTKSTGTGLGLSTVYGIVEQSGGTIALESTPWVGTTFTIHFPVTDEQPFVPPPTGDVSTYGDELILLVEDEETLRAMTATELSAHGYRVLQAANASEALAIARERIGEIRLLVTDVIMPGLSGRELADRLVPQSGGTMKVLYVSGYADDAVLRAGVSRHHTAFVQKPYLPEDLARRVRSLLDA